MESYRLIRNRSEDTTLRDLLQTLFVAELMTPGRRLWMVSPWITDIPVLDNCTGEFASLVPEWDYTPIRLSQFFNHLAGRMTEIFLVTRENTTSPNASFANLMMDLEEKHPERFHFRFADLVHEKGLLSESFFLSGSFNYTLNGISINDEVAHLFTIDETIAGQQVAYSRIWNNDGVW